MDDLLFITPITPRVQGMGCEKRAWSHLEALTSLGNVHCLIFTPSTAMPNTTELAQINSLASSVFMCTASDGEPVVHDKVLGLSFFHNLIRPNNTSNALTASTGEQISKKFSAINFKAVLCFRIRSFPIWEILNSHYGITTNRLSVDFDDIESLALSRRLKYESDLLGKEGALIARLTLSRINKLESRILNVANHVLVCSEKDKLLLDTRKNKATVIVLPNIAPKVERLGPIKNNNSLNIIFVGSMGYPPNSDGAIFFCNEVWPLIKEKYQQHSLNLQIIRYRPPETVLNLASNTDIEVTGGVGELTPYYENASLVIVPIRFGGGTRIKVLEAMAYGRPVVSTTIGAEGIEYTHGENILIANAPAEFASTCVKLLESPTLAADIKNCAYKLVSEKYSLEGVIPIFKEIINS